MFGWVSGEGGTSPLTVAEPKGNQLGEDKMLMKERKVLSFHFFFFQESTAGNRMGKELTYKRVVAFHPSPSKGLSHMPGNVKHTAAQHHSLTESGPPRTESSPKGRAVGKRARLPAWGGGGGSSLGQRGFPKTPSSGTGPEPFLLQQSDLRRSEPAVSQCF